MEGQSRFNERYRVKGHLAGGAHGIILWAVDRSRHGRGKEVAAEMATGTEQTLQTQYAVKRIFTRNRVVPVSIIREIKSLQFLAGHPNIIELVEVCPLGSSINLVFPLLPLNLATLIYEHSLNLVQVSIYFRMAVEGVAHLHRQGVMHRDLKPSNMLIDWNGVLKLCDFGQARDYQPDAGELSYQVCTRWYRAPELLYGSTSYNTDVDIWSLGCVLAEMLQEWPLFKGENDIEQLGLVVKALGPPPEGEWTERLPDYNKIQFLSPDDDDSDDDVDDDCELYLSEDEEDQKKASLVPLPKWIRKLANTLRSRHCPRSAMSMLATTCRYIDRPKAEQMLLHPFLHQVRINNGETVVVLGNTSSMIGDSALEQYLVKAKGVKHLSGPPRNSEPRQKCNYFIMEPQQNQQTTGRVIETQTAKATGDARRELQKQLEISGLFVKGDAWSVLVDGYNFGRYSGLRDYVDQLTEVLFTLPMVENFIDRSQAEEGIRLLNERQKTPPDTIDNQPAIQIRSVSTDGCANVTNLGRTNFKHHFSQLVSTLQKLPVFESGQFHLTPLDYLNTYDSSEDFRCVVLALLKRNPMKINEFTLEDGTGKVPVVFNDDVDFREVAIFLSAIYLIEGTYNGSEDMFRISSIGLPPPVADILPEPKEIANLPNDPLVIIVRDVHLDKADTIDRLRYLFSGYDACDEVPDMFIFIGNFLSQTADEQILRDHFRRLLKLISAFSHLVLKSHFVFIPGPNDRTHLETFVEEKFSKELLEAGQIRNISLATNPAFLQIYGRRLAFYTEPVFTRLSKNLINSAHDIGDLKRLARQDQDVVNDHLTAIGRLLVINAHLTTGQSPAFAEPLAMFPRVPDRILISTGKTNLDHQHVALFDERVHLDTLPSFTCEDGKFVAYYVLQNNIERSQVVV